jgi:Tol biopolymer transport system component
LRSIRSGSNRLGSAIGGNTVAYIDLGLQANGELVVHDLVAGTSVRLTNDVAVDQDPSVSPDGNTVTWEHCTADLSDCDIWQAVKTGGVWTVGVVSATASVESNPDSNGTLVVYDSDRGSGSKIFWRPVAGGAELQLQLPTFDRNPSIAGHFVCFESQQTLAAATDIW